MSIFAFFYSMNPTHLAPDKQAKWFLLKTSFSQRYSKFKFEKFDSAQCQSARNKKIFISKPIKRLKKCWSSLQQLTYILQGKKRPAKTKCVPAKLCAELVIAKSDSTQCQSARSLTLCSVSQFGIVNKVSANKNMSPSVSEIFGGKKIV